MLAASSGAATRRASDTQPARTEDWLAEAAGAQSAAAGSAAGTARGPPGTPFANWAWTPLLSVSLAAPGGSGSQGCFALPARAAADHVLVRVLSNFGRTQYTCLYGVKLLGTFVV